MTTKKLRVALIGFGGMGHFHAAQYREQKHCRLVAICDTDPAQFEKMAEAINLGDSGAADLSGVNTYGSYAELIKKESFDVLDICLPCPLHAKYAIRAMKDGYHVLCEKPMARTLAQTDAMLQTMRETGKQLMIAQCVRFMKPYEVLKEAVDSGKYGRLLSLNFRRCGSMPTRPWYRDPRQSGGALLDLHLHDTDFIQSLLGMPKAVLTLGTVRDTGGVDDLLTNYFYDGIDRVSAVSSWCHVAWNSGTVAVFEKATLAVDLAEVRIGRLDQPDEVLDFKGDNGYANEIDYFTGCILAGVRPEKCLPESTRESIRLALLEERSARRRCKVTVR